MEAQGSERLVRAALKVSLGSLVILALATFAGTEILEFFGVSLPAFRAAGGLVLIIIGLEMLRGESSAVLSDRDKHSDAEDHLWVPLVMPLIAGPGAITTVITLSIREQVTFSRPPLGTLAAVGVATSVVFLMLLLARPIARTVSPRSARVFERFFGLILVAIGFQLGLSGIQLFFQSPAV